MPQNLKFVLRVASFHVITYILCGVVFSAIFNYNSLFAIDGVSDYMRKVASTSTLLVPLVQVVRGLLFGVVFLLFKDYLFYKKFGWLKLWIILSIIGIINTPGPSPSSLEGLVYTKLPLQFHIMAAPELLTQTLLFSYFVVKPYKEKQSKLVHINELLPAIVAGALFSLSGIFLALILKIDIAKSIGDIGALCTMFIAMLVVFEVTKWNKHTSCKYKNIVSIISYYFVLAVLPYTYNWITNSPFNSSLILLINLASTALLFIYLS